MRPDITKPTPKSPAEQASAPKGKALKNKKISMIIMGTLLVLSLSGAIFFYVKYHEVKNDPSEVTAAQTDAVVKKVSKLMVLPSDETPTVATVSDKTKLKDQPFFSKAQNNDQLIIFTNAKQAIIYRPSENKIVNVGPISLSDKATAKQ